MKKILLIALLMSAVFTGIGLCFTGINPTQPISIGQELYEDNSVKVLYIGVQNNTLQIQIAYQYNSQSYNYPINDKKQALVTVNQDVQLLITVVDEFYRVRVESYRG